MLRGHAREHDLQMPWYSGPCLHSSLISHHPLIPHRLPAPYRLEVVLWCLVHVLWCSVHIPYCLCALFPLLDPRQVPSSKLSFHTMTPYIILHSPEQKFPFLSPFLHKITWEYQSCLSDSLLFPGPCTLPGSLHVINKHSFTKQIHLKKEINITISFLKSQLIILLIPFPP